MSVSDETAPTSPVSGAARGEIDARENGAAYAREAVELLADSMRPGDDFADKHLSQAIVHAVLALYCELRGQADDRVAEPLVAGPTVQLLAELTEAVRQNTAALAEHTRALQVPPEAAAS
ncbi:MAG: hypothetical protein WCA46_29630 [Actinocatenispora sp.]